MHIVIDTRWAEYKAGVYRVIVHLFTELILLDAAKEHSYTLLGVDIFAARNLPLPSNVRIVPLKGKMRKLCQGIWKSPLRFLFPLELLVGRIDYAYFTNFVSVPMLSCKLSRFTRFFGQGRYCVTVHDMAWKVYPETIEEKNLRFLERFCQSSLDDAEHIHCVSQFTADEVARHLDVDTSRLVVAHNAVMIDENTTTLSAGDTEASLEGRYILFVGTLEPRKNLSLLISAFVDAWDRGQSWAEDMKVVIVGAQGWKEKMLVPEVFADRFIFKGFVEDDELSSLYRSAFAFIFPSKYEGFGIPLLEAFSYGVPTICFDGGAMREVAGDGALYISEESALSDIQHHLKNLSFDGPSSQSVFDPERGADSLLEQLSRFSDAVSSEGGVFIHRNNGSEMRAALSERAKKRVFAYTWKESARILRDLV